ncbi:hypothetical protein YC2023_018584 [Brassica napus]
MRPRGHAPGRQISLITAMRIQDQEFLLPSGATDHLQQISTDTSDLHQPNLRVQTRPRPRKNPEKETSERRYVHAKPKGPATDKPVLMPTEASSVSPSGLAPTR